MNDGTDVREVDFCTFDLETTGISTFSKIVEIGAVRFRVGGSGDEYTTLVDPRQPIPVEASYVHGITDPMVAGSPRVDEVVGSFFDFIGDSVLLAHNAAFDVGVLSMELAKCGAGFPSNRVLDTVGIARMLIRGLYNYRLPTLAAYLGLDTDELHRALPDARATRRVLEHALEQHGAGPISLGEITGMTSVFKIGQMVENDFELPVELACIFTAIETGKVLTVVYEGGTRVGRPRQLTPVGLYKRRGVAYMEAYCHEDGFNKSFRIDRIVSIIEDER